MNMKEVKDLIQEILQSDISEFELEHTGTKLKLRRGAPQPQASSPSMIPVPSYTPPAPVTPMVLEHTAAPAAVAAEESDEEGLHLITSPIVGTFYRSPSPGAEAYVKIGQMVEEGTTLCIVEAMKLMNEIPSDVAGEVVRMYVENGSPVEFGQKLFGIRARK
jgi:acetyl-CoA carboxylase biotin carboxyl carrier protein